VILNETYLAIIETVDRVEYLLENYKGSPYDLEEFTEDFEHFFNESVEMTEARFFVSIFEEKFTSLCELYLKMSNENSLSEADAGCDKYLALTEEIANAVKVLVAYYEKNKAILANLPDREIISGINETVAIKVENLTEAQAELAALKTEAENRGGPEPAKIILDAWNDGSVIGEKPAKKNDAKTVKRRKKLDEFIKTKIFSEIISIEEIENYSIPKLEESREYSTADYLKVFGEATDRINQILAARDIKRIAPKPREPFEAQYHEILLAETREGFSKGEIIKLVSKGFMEGDKVYIRANVIASR
jgi:molecular chaperone GrpE (heat shock protein)